MKYLPALLVAFSILLSCNPKKESFQALDIDLFEDKLNATPDKILLDVRTLPEYQEGHLKNSVMIDFQSGYFAQQVDKLDRSKPVFVYCAAGGRSEKAAIILIDKGFREVYHMKGGVHEWQGADKPMVTY